MEFGDPGRPVVMNLWENGARVAATAKVHTTAKVHPGAVIGPATVVEEYAEICDGAVIGPVCRIPVGAVIARGGIVGTRNDGYLHILVPGGPYSLDAHYAGDELVMSVGCVTRRLAEWEIDWPDIAKANNYSLSHSEIVVAFMKVARLLARPQDGVREVE